MYQTKSSGDQGLVVRRFRKKPKSKLSVEAKREVRSLISKGISRNAESKQHSVSVAPGIVFDGAGGVIISQLTNMAQGVADNQRVGDEATLKWLRVHMFFSNQAGATANPYTFFRVVIFQYHRSDNAPQIAELFLVSSANGGATYGTFSSRNIDYMGIYNVLYDKTIKTVQGAANAANYGANSSYAQELQIRVPLKYAKRKIQYLAASTTSTNGIYILITTGQVSTATDPVTAYTATVGFTDS